MNKYEMLTDEELVNLAEKVTEQTPKEDLIEIALELLKRT